MFTFDCHIVLIYYRHIASVLISFRFNKNSSKLFIWCVETEETFKIATLAINSVACFLAWERKFRIADSRARFQKVTKRVPFSCAQGKIKSAHNKLHPSHQLKKRTKNGEDDGAVTFSHPKTIEIGMHQPFNYVSFCINFLWNAFDSFRRVNVNRLPCKSTALQLPWSISIVCLLPKTLKSCLYINKVFFAERATKLHKNSKRKSNQSIRRISMPQPYKKPMQIEYLNVLLDVYFSNEYKTI